MLSQIEFKIGDLVKIKIIDKQVSSDGLSLGSIIYEKNQRIHDKLIVYEKISTENFPSCNDFFGKQTLINHDDVAMVIRKVGSPIVSYDQTNKEFISINSEYDVYEIITCEGSICQVFKKNIEKIVFKKKPHLVKDEVKN